MTFLLDWELTFKCNLDCDYCAGHDNSTKHPPLDRCKKSVDFMLAYTDLYMSKKAKGIRDVVINVYGGESLHHPDIVTILQYIKERHADYQASWPLTVTCTTNAIVSSKKFEQIIPLVDEFTVSFHPQNSKKQHDQFKKNLLAIQKYGSRLKCIAMMHNKGELFDLSVAMVQWCADHGIACLPKQIDHPITATRFNYDNRQIMFFEKLYNKRSYKSTVDLSRLDKETSVNMAAVGRSCCGGRQVCLDQDRSSRLSFVQNRFPNWFCSVNEFFLHVKQITEEIFVNKDCKMSFDGNVGPIGSLSNSQDLLDWTKHHLEKDSMPVIQCQKQACFCGLCAPKAKHLDTYQSIMVKYRK